MDWLGGALEGRAEQKGGSFSASLKHSYLSVPDVHKGHGEEHIMSHAITLQA